MSTTLLADERQRTTSIHPPDTEDRQILTIPDRDDLRRLPLSDRLSLRLGLWLLERSLSTGDAADAAPLRREGISEHQALTLLTYDLQRGLR